MNIDHGLLDAIGVGSAATVAAGHLTGPPVPDPSEIATSPAATVAALPPDEPPGTQSGLCGFLVGP